MCNIPLNCILCPFENRCDTYYKSPKCRFHTVEDDKEKISWVARIKKFLAKSSKEK